MKLRPKIVLAISLVLAPYSVGAWALQRWTILPGFVAMEEREARRQAERACDAIAAEIVGLDRFCSAWARRDDTYAFLEDASGAGRDPSFAEKLESGAVEAGELTVLRCLDPAGRLVWSAGRSDLEVRDGEAVAMPASDWPLDHPLLADREGVRRGLIATSRGPMLVAAQQVVDRERTRPPRGWLVVGRLLDGELTTELARRTRVELEVLPIDARLDPDALAISSELRASSDVAIRERDETALEAYARVDGLDGGPAALVRARVPRDITARGAEALRIAAACGLAAALVLAFALWFVLVRTIVHPLQELTRHAIAIGQRDGLGARLAMRRDDEIGALSVELDLMIEKLSRSRARLLETARADGMSEVATRVLHDVGNALNSVNVSSGVISEKAASAALRDLGRAMKLLSEHEHDLGRYLTEDERGRRLLDFLAAVAAELEAERTALQSEARCLKESIDHMQALVSEQQGFARRDEVVETVVLRDLVEVAWRLASAKSGGAARLSTSFDGCPPLVLHRHKLLQILVNLLRNARESQEGRAEPLEVRVRARPLGSERIRIEVEDDGCGIAPEHLARIFEHGFTTKRKGHGFGLHTAALAAAELGGGLSARSAGRGAGACFVLELPLRKAAASEAA